MPCWPLDCNRCCPSGVMAWVPAHLKIVQDCTHLCLMLSTILGFVIAWRDGYKVYADHCDSFWYCAQEVLDFLFLVPCTLHIVQMLGYYDDRRQRRLKGMEEKRKELMDTYAAMVQDMDGMLGRSAESNAGLAEKNFAANRRDFLRFLEQASARFGDAFPMSANDEKKFLVEFRSLIRHWLRVFQEASVDPVKHPLLIERFEGELDLFQSVKTLVDEVKDRLQTIDTGLIASRRAGDEQAVKELEDHVKGSPSSAPRQQQMGDDTRSSIRDLEAGTQDLQPRLKRCIWWHCGLSGCGYTFEDGDYPLALKCGCCTVDMLGSDHLRLCMACCVGFLLIVVNWTAPLWTNKYEEHFLEGHMDVYLLDAAPVTIYTLCLVVLLAHIENISELICLEREVKVLQAEEKKVTDMKNEMTDFWGNVQQLSDIWVYRTIPRLDLLKEANLQIEGLEAIEVIGQLSAVNKRLLSLEQAVGDCESWRNKMELDDGNKDQRRFAEQINGIIRDGGEGISTLARSIDDALLDDLGTFRPPSQPALQDNGRAGGSAPSSKGQPKPHPKKGQDVQMAEVRREDSDTPPTSDSGEEWVDNSTSEDAAKKANKYKQKKDRKRHS